MLNFPETNAEGLRRVADLVEDAFNEGLRAGTSYAYDPLRDSWADWVDSTAHEHALELRLHPPAIFINAAFVDDKAYWSQETYGPGERLDGVLAHIRKELVEVRKAPKDVTEWADVILLAFDGASRQGISGEQLIRAIIDKDQGNRTRRYPDWRTMPSDVPIEHVRDDATGHVDNDP